MTSQPQPISEMTTELLQAHRQEIVKMMEILTVVQVSELPYQRRKEHTVALSQARMLLTAIDDELTRRMVEAIAQRAQEILPPEQLMVEEQRASRLNKWPARIGDGKRAKQAGGPVLGIVERPADLEERTES